MKALLDQFITAIDAEIALIEKEGFNQSFELLSGQLDEKSTGTLYVFVLADTLRLPEDASGTLHVGGTQASALIVAQEGNRVWLLLESLEPLPDYLPTARLVVDETDLLKRLKEKLQMLRSAPSLGLAPKVFGREASRVGFAQAPPEVNERLNSSEPTRRVLEQSIGSEVTFIWGPPGTGKTFTIAAIVASLAMATEETTLVASHTHAAVEQALWALVERPEDQRLPGLLFGSDLVDEGRVLKVGPLKSEKIPRLVHLDSYLEDKRKEHEENLRALREEAANVASEASKVREQLRPWLELNEIRAGHNVTVDEHVRATDALEHARIVIGDAKNELNEAESLRVKAESSFFIGRKGRTEKASAGIRAAQANLRRAESEVANADARLLRVRSKLAFVEEDLKRAERATEGLRASGDLEVAFAALHDRQTTVEAEIETLTSAAEQFAEDLVRNARALFVTLTKLYRDRGVLSDMTWDTVIIDEASMAMPPLVAYAAAHARKRVVIVGDMYQLPPVVRSEPDTTGGILGKDVFELRGITELIGKGQEFPALAKLTTQRRMHPEVASVAKDLIKEYANLEDGSDVLSRPSPRFAHALADGEPLATVDIADLHPWSGKMPGSLSRFNFLSGQVAVELAALYAAFLDRPGEKSPPPIGIVTPYAAQRRFLNKLVQMLGLEPWVVAGTVHTFQGNECDVIIFDSVLGEPHWTARLTNPFEFKDVKRDLNVAVTRARHQFVFVGDSKWLKKNAKAGSGYGTVWRQLEKHATHLSASDLLGDGLRARVAQSVTEISGWTLPDRASTTLLTETDFYPAFAADLSNAKDKVILFTPFIGKTRWPVVEPHIASVRERGVEVYLLHKPLSDPEWRRGDSDFGRKVFNALLALGVKLIPMSGVHAKTIVIDSHIVYEGSLNWASQTASYEHMWRFDSRDMAALVEKMIQLEPIVEAYRQEKVGDQCPYCHGGLMIINQAQLSRQDVYPVKLGCCNHAEDKDSCEGYLRRVDGRPPFLKPPVCQKGSPMRLHPTNSGRPWDWRCEHKTCKPIRWARGDCTG